MQIHLLVQRYGITRQAVADRIAVLQIQRVGRGEISEADVELMDKYHAHIKQGGTIETFPYNPEIIKTQIINTSDNSNLTTENNSNEWAEHLIQTVNLLVDKIVLDSKQVSKCIDNYEALLKIANHGYAVETAVIELLVGRKIKGKKSFRYGSFLISLSAFKIGNSKCWYVSLSEKQF